MEVLRPFPGVLAMLAIALVLPSSAAAQGRLSSPGGAPLASTFKPAKGKFKAVLGLTVRNDSSYSGPLRVKLVYDDGTTVRLRRKRRTMTVAGQTLKLWLKRRGKGRLLIGPRSARRLTVKAWVKPLPKSALGATLVVSGRPKSTVSPLAVPVKLSPPAAKPAAPSIWHEADVEPPEVVINVYRLLPSPIAPTWLLVDRQNVQVKGIGGGEDVEAGKRLTIEPVSGDTGGRGSVEIWAPWGIKPAEHRATIRADVRRITNHGTYEATIPLAEGDDKSATLKVTTHAADLFIWPLLALLAGALLAYWQLKDQEEVRPKEVLKLALTDLQTAHAKDHEDDKTSPVPYDLDIFPSDTASWDDCANNDKPEAQELYCRIGGAKLDEDLDDIQEKIADLDARVTGWPVSRAKVAKLEAARELLEEHGAEAEAMVEAAKALEHPAKAPASAKALKTYHEKVDAQVEAIQTWILARAMLAEGARLHAELGTHDADHEMVRRHNPDRWLDDLKTAKTGDDLDRCGVLDGVCRDLHLVRSLVLSPAPPPPPEDDDIDVIVVLPDGDRLRASLKLEGEGEERRQYAYAERRITSGDIVVTETEAQEPVKVPAGPSHLAPSPSISARRLDGLQAGDRRSFLWAFLIATLAYFVGIYNETFGSLIDYLTAFAAGAGTMYVANFKLLPWFRSYRPPKAA